MGFKSSIRLSDNIEVWSITFGPSLYIQMALVGDSKKFWNLYLTRKVSNQVIANINYDRGETEQTIISDMLTRMVVQTEHVSTKLLSDKIKTQLV